jgi:NTP pyrophosphatase (non-canonical NTP hydrolase)
VSHAKYKHIGEPEDRVVEEVGEVLQALSKARRFGWFNVNPEDPGRTNIDRVRAEVDDLIEALNSLDVKMKEMQHARLTFKKERNSHESRRKDGC